MNPFVAIALEVITILTLVGGAAGMLLSLGLLIAPERIRKMDAFLSRSYHFKERLACFDRPVQNPLFIYRHPLVFGLLLVMGAGVTLVFLLLQMDIDHLLSALGVREDRRLLWELALDFMVLTGKIAGVAGLAIGLSLIVAPDRLRRLDSRLNQWIATQPLVDRLDGYNDALDGFSFRHPVLIGILGVLLSAILIFLSLSRFY